MCSKWWKLGWGTLGDVGVGLILCMRVRVELISHFTNRPILILHKTSDRWRYTENLFYTPLLWSHCKFVPGQCKIKISIFDRLTVTFLKTSKIRILFFRSKCFQKAILLFRVGIKCLSWNFHHSKWNLDSMIPTGISQTSLTNSKYTFWKRK